MFCRAVEETTKAGLQLFSREDLLAARKALEALSLEVERAKLQIAQLTGPKPH
jgi:hypothetical protein